MKKKTCPKCGIAKPASAKHFYKKEGTSDGLSYLCKPCISANSKKYRKEIVRGTRTAKAYVEDRTPDRDERQTIDVYLGQVDKILLQAGPETARQAAMAIMPTIPDPGRIELQVMIVAMEQMIGRAARKKKSPLL